MTPDEIDIERKEFEEMMREKHPFMSLEKLPDGSCYIDRDVFYMLKGWLACCESRDNVCVVLPNPDIEIPVSALNITVYGHSPQSIKSMLQSSGISYREEE